ncbi:MAG: tellurite resistance TerB family protein, partial [Rhodospirillales bacterium]
MINHHSALIFSMVMVSAADQDMTDAELRRIGWTINDLPVFADFEAGQLPAIAASCAEVLDDDDGLNKAFDLIVAALPEKLRETAYALACDIAAADGEVHQEELRMLEMMRH